MNHYQQSLVIEASPAVIYAALTTAQGLRGWWTADSDVATAIGETHVFRFGPHFKHLRIEVLEPDQQVRWLCTAARIDMARFTRKDEWVGTQIVFRLAASGTDQTRLDFEHIGLVPSFECHEICVDGWRHFLESLRLFAQTGHGTPFAAECAASASN